MHINAQVSTVRTEVHGIYGNALCSTIILSAHVSVMHGL